MLNLKNNDNDAVFDEICKKKRRLKYYKISKNEGYFFGQHTLVENSPTATATYYPKNANTLNSDSNYRSNIPF